MRRLIKDIFIFATGNILSKIILLILMPLYTSVLTTAEYGIAEILNTLVELFIPIFTLCIADAVFRYSINEEDVNKEDLFMMGLYTILFGVIISFLLVIVLNFLKIKYVIILWFIFVTYSIKQFLGCYLRGIGNSTSFAFSGVITTIMLVGFNIYFLTVLDKKLYGYLWSIALSNVIGIFVMIYFINPIKIVKRNLFSPFSKKGKKIEKKMLKYSLPIIPNSISWWLNTVVNRYILLYICGSAATGLFSAISKLAAVVNLLSAIFQQAWQYSSALEYEKKTRDEYYSQIFFIYFRFVIISCTIIIYTSQIFSKYILLGDFQKGIKYVPLIIFSSMLGCFSVFFGGIYTASKNNQMLMLSTIIGTIINILFSFILGFNFNILGVIIASNISYAVVVIIRILDTRKYVNIKINYYFFLFSIISLFVLSLYMTFTKKINIFSLLVTILIIFINIKEIIVVFIKKRK